MHPSEETQTLTARTPFLLLLSSTHLSARPVFPMSVASEVLGGDVSPPPLALWFHSEVGLSLTFTKQHLPLLLHRRYARRKLRVKCLARMRPAQTADVEQPSVFHRQFQSGDACITTQGWRVLQLVLLFLREKTKRGGILFTLICILLTLFAALTFVIVQTKAFRLPHGLRLLLVLNRKF